MVHTSQIGRRLARKRARKAFTESMVKPRLTDAQVVALLEADGAIGAWAHREDIGDSAEYARELRRQVEAQLMAMMDTDALIARQTSY